MIFSYARNKITRFKTFFKRFKSQLDWNADIPCSHLITYNIEESRDYFIFPPKITNPGCIAKKRFLEGDLHFYISNNENQMRYHYFTVKSYFKNYCEDIFERAYYHNIDTSALHPYMVLLKYLFLNKNIWCVIFLYFVHDL